MAVNTVTGVDGGVTVADQTLDIYQWTANFQRDVHEVTAFGSKSNAKTKVGGMMSCTGSFDAWFTGTTPVLTDILEENHVGATLNLILEAAFTSTDMEYSFVAILTNITTELVKDGLVAVSATFQSSGVITSTEGTDI